MASRDLAVVLCVTLGACTTTLAPVERGAEIAVVAATEPALVIEASTKQLVAKDAGVGFGIGYVGGALGGLACGPLAVLCVPAFAMVGGLTGGVGGALVGVAEALPDETFRQLDARMRAFAERHNPSDCVINAVRSRVASRYTLVNDVSAASVTVLTIRVTEAAVYTNRDHQAHLVVRVSVTPTFAGHEPRRLAPLATSFSYVGQMMDARTWVDGENDIVTRSLDEACEQIADQVLTALIE